MNKKIIAEYIWIGGNGELRSKARTLDSKYTKLPEWNYDGSSTNQAPGYNSEVILKPKASFSCPFRKDDNILVLCDTYTNDNKPLKTNTRFEADRLFKMALDERPWFGLEQEFFIFDTKTNEPLRASNYDIPTKQGQYYCSVGNQNAFGRKIIEEHYKACLYAGLTISGINAEVAPAQWEYQIGPCVGIDAGDQLWISRYILYRLSEKYNVSINMKAKPLKGDWNGSGCHTNYSTKSMREGTKTHSGLDIIKKALTKLKNKHKEHMAVYGNGNKDRLTGQHETAKYDTFSYGVANRGASVRIPYITLQNKKGYFEDRRPSANMDPYLVTGILFKTTVLD